MSRPHCARCLRPQSHCLCPYIQHCRHRHPLMILQHPSEQKQAKGTAHLACLALEQAQLIPGEQPEDFAALRQAVEQQPQQYWLIYPSEHSQSLEQQACLALTQQTTLHTPALYPTLIFLDGTWRKAQKLWHLNPWLHTLPQFHFTSPPQGQYKIRKTAIAQGLSTIEAIGYALQQVEAFNPRPLSAILEALVTQQLKAMPQQVQARY
ncbi:tRNA-uridine aminocarboxypropyltransferase [Agarivorans sp. QJM3NY_33]|uniref:tRNA-uridine aminocarboxypropyltransferase n=1 Tax=Agarivorans sp. QJM3NY_33 TaxID=3421432 RepID=UPI003D7E325A